MKKGSIRSDFRYRRREIRHTGRCVTMPPTNPSVLTHEDLTAIATAVAVAVAAAPKVKEPVKFAYLSMSPVEGYESAPCFGVDLTRTALGVAGALIVVTFATFLNRP